MFKSSNIFKNQLFHRSVAKKMHTFTVLSFIAFTTAVPQGYNYPVQPDIHYLSPGAGSAINEQDVVNFQQQPLISKRFFLHSAPEEEEVEVQHRNIVVGQPRKNFNVVFIKSAAAAAKKTKVRVIPAINEEKTVIYVLAKKAGEDEVTAHVEESHTTTAKPEVFFIKYNTNEEAEHAQRRIQAEYDNLGGSSIISKKGIAPVSSVIGSLDVHSVAGGRNGVGTVTGAEVSGSAYLPPVNKQ